ncbi:MAG: degQ 2 [Candidatus Aminicenantes bacterium]|nr:degQ 2 [Candidatus Aminicenantes bacterium]
MPTQPVHDLKIHPREAELIVATHGRGAYIADIKALQELSPAVLASDVHLFTTQPGIRWIGQDRRESGSSNFAGESEPAGVTVSYLLKAKPKEGVKVRIYAGTLLLNEIAGKAEAGLNTVVWNMTGRRERTPEEKEAAQTMARRAREAGYGGAGGDTGFASFPVQPGEYRVVLDVDGKTLSTTATVLRDPRY